jgi:hypothetical protein
MNKEIADIWANALESGKYKQGYGALRNLNNQHCCLGVLTDLYCRTHNYEQWIPEGSFYVFQGLHGYLSEEVQKWAGIKSRNGNFRDTAPYTLSQLNDTGYDFSKIAQTIRQNWENL